MKLKKLLLVIEIILAIFLIIGIVYLSYKLYLKVMGIQDYAQVGNREIFYTCGSKYGDATIYENGLMIIKDGMKEKAKINLSKDEIKEIKKLINKDKKDHSEETFPDSGNGWINTDRVVKCYGYYYSILDPAIPRTVYNGDYSEKYVFKLLEKYSNN